MKIAFIGGGNMASALIGGMLRQGFDAGDVSAVEPSEESRTRLFAQSGIACSAAHGPALGDVDVIVMAVKPQHMREAAQSIAPFMAQQLVVSIAAGTRMADLGRWLGGHRKIVRCMPNTPALVGLGITGMFASSAVSANQRSVAERVLRAVGEVVWVGSEALLDPVTAVSGSGPAYVFYFLEALTEAGAKLGLGQDDAKRLALATFTGAAKLAADSSDDLATLRAKVTSKGGTTEAALKLMAERHVKESIMAAVEAASARGTELGAMLGRD